MNEKAIELFGNEAFLEKISSMDDIEEVKKAFAAEGVTLDVEAMKAQVTTNTDEIAEDDLEEVAGGGIFATAWNIGKRIGIIGRTLFEDATGRSRSYSNKDVMWAINF